MLKVKEFKDLGVVFVCGDVCKRADGDPFTVNAIWVNGSVANGFRDEQKVVSFAWRPLNTLPDNPKFKYEIGGHMPQWRPLLEQSLVNFSGCTVTNSNADIGYCANKTTIPDMKLKPVFTQEMADKCELPPVGSLFRIHRHNYIMVGLSSTGSVVGEHCEFAEYKGFHARDCKPIDTRTPKQKAVDAACESIKQDHNKLVVGIVSDLYDKGFIKC